MKKVLLTLAIVLLAMAAQAQNTSFKVHSDGQISLQSATTSYGIQILSSGVASFEPNILLAYGQTSVTKARTLLAKAWDVKLVNIAIPSSSSFYVLGNGNVFAYGSYLTYSPPANNDAKGFDSIEGASDIVSRMKGYYQDNHEYDGITPEDFENNENILPEALDGLLKDLDKEKVIGMNAEELEEVLPEAVRHDPEGRMAINYNAVVTVLVEAVKEQQARIDQLESILRENGLLNGKK